MNGTGSLFFDGKWKRKRSLNHNYIDRKKQQAYRLDSNQREEIVCRVRYCDTFAFFIFGCWGILLLLMLLYGPWMIQAKQITIPDISITNFMIRDTSSFFPMHQEAAEQLIGEGKAVLSATEAVPNKLPNMRLVVFLLLLFPLCTKVLRTRFSESLLVPHLSDIRGMLPLPLAPPSGLCFS